MEIETLVYTHENREQVMDLICQEYNRDKSKYAKFFENFYEHEYQKDAIKTVAIEKSSGKVVGFFALFTWPYFYEGKKLYSYKGVNAIVDPNYRGKGIFNNILNLADETLKNKEADFLIATPLDAAFYGFLKNGWKHLIDLDWNIKIINPMAFLHSLSTKKIKQFIPEEKTPNIINLLKNNFQLSDEPDFVQWRKNFYRTEKFYISYKKGEKTIQFGLKLNVRKKIIRELIIGEISTNSDDSQFIKEGFEMLLKKVKQLKSITIVSIAVNPKNKRMVDNISNLGFRLIKNKIHIVVKDLSENNTLMNPEKWTLFRADLDSW